jgi:hypothetical protein
MVLGDKEYVMSRWTKEQMGQMDRQLENMREERHSQQRLVFEQWTKDYGPGTARDMQLRAEAGLRRDAAIKARVEAKIKAMAQGKAVHISFED